MANGILEERAFSEVARLCRAGLDGPELLRATIERLRRVVPFEAYCASTVDPASGLVTRSLAEEMGGAEEAEIFFERLYFEYDLNQFKKMARDGRPVALLSEAAGGRLERSPRHRELLGPLGLAHELRAVFATGGRMWGAMDLIREKGRPDFEPRHVALLRRLASPVGAGLRAAALRAQTAAKPDGADSPGVLTLDRSGRVVQHTPAAERWLRDLDDLEPGWREWTGLPPAVRMVSGALKRAPSPGPDGDLNSVPRLRVRGRSGRWLTLHGSLTEATPDRPAETVIVVEPAKPEEVAWLNVAAYGLSAREKEVIQHVVRGASTREISQALHISEYTVQNHLSNVFAKVGVRSRKELVRRLFFDNLYPTLFG
jgi:DNA-binding CsgD family transcriptional regulator